MTAIAAQYKEAPMKKMRLAFATFLWMLLIPLPSSALAALLDDLVAAAKREGTLELYAPSSLTPEGVQKLGDAFNTKFGLDIKVNYSPSGSMIKDVSRVVTEAAAGVPPDWDLMVVTDAHHAVLWLKKLHCPFDYAKLGVDPRAIQYDHGTVILANQFALPAYNAKVLRPQDVPKRWENLLDPKWSGGKLGIGTTTHHLARLAAAWGEEKTTGFVRDLAKQQPLLGELGSIYSRLQLGEVQIAISMTDSFIHQAKVTGAPIVFAERVEPVISPAYNAGVLKGARHPNAATLFGYFLTTPEAQKIWEKYGGQTSAFVPGTPAYHYAQGKKVLFMAQDHAEMVSRLTALYGKILGFTR